MYDPYLLFVLFFLFQMFSVDRQIILSTANFVFRFAPGIVHSVCIRLFIMLNLIYSLIPLTLGRSEMPGKRKKWCFGVPKTLVVNTDLELPS